MEIGENEEDLMPEVPASSPEPVTDSLDVPALQVKKLGHNTHKGQKIDQSNLVFIVTRMLNSGETVANVVKILRDKYSFNVTQPSVFAFKKNCYPRRLAELQKRSVNFKTRQAAEMKSYIEESMEQVHQIKVSVDNLVKQAKRIEERIKFTDQFESLLMPAFERFKTDADAKRKFLEGTEDVLPQEELELKKFLLKMGSDPAEALLRFVSRRDVAQLSRLYSVLQREILTERAAVVKIRHDIFKSYKGMSLLQELTLIFERYNEIVITEFFPTKESINTKKFEAVRARIFEVYDQFKLKFQGVDNKKDSGSSVSVSSPTTLNAPKPQVKEGPLKAEEQDLLDEFVSGEEDDLFAGIGGDDAPGFKTE